ncbi:MAG: glycosyltransferase family 8 protein [Gemmobacter sp.]
MRIVAQTGAAAHRRAVVFCLNAAWLPYGAFAARQIALLPGRRDFDICIASTEPLVLPEGLRDLGLRLVQIDVGDFAVGQQTDTRLGAESYVRLVMPELLEGDYDRILYLDADIFVSGGDFGALMDADLGGLCVGAVRDQLMWRPSARPPPEFGAAGLEGGDYFNSGVMLIDIPAFLAADVCRRALALGREKGHLFASHDQSLLNVCLHGAWAELSPVWNWQWYLARPFYDMIVAANIVHFITPLKPWRESGKACMAMGYRKAYAAFLSAYFPDVPRAEPRVPPRMRSGWWWFVNGLRHVQRRGQLLRYLDRFPTDTTVHLP